MKQSSRGFTLIELVVTVAIVGILASIAVPLAEVNMRRAKEQELRSALRSIRTALDAYKQATEDGRILRQADGSGYPRSLEELDGGVADAKSPNQTKIYFLRRLPRDPFATDATATAAETWGKRSYASPPDAPQEGADVYDVYSLSTLAGLNGTAYRAW
jgi:general secretion pathway protein G